MAVAYVFVIVCGSNTQLATCVVVVHVHRKVYVWFGVVNSGPSTQLEGVSIKICVHRIA